MPLLWVALAFLCGVWIASGLPLPGWAWLALGTGVLAAAWAARRFGASARLREGAAWLFSPLPALRAAPVWLLVFLCAGGLRYTAARPVPAAGDISAQIGAGRVIVRGVIGAPPEHAAGGYQARVSVESVRVLPDAGPAGPALPVRGVLLADLPASRAWSYGDELRLTGALRAPPAGEDFSYRAYLARQGVFAEMPYAAAQWIASGKGSPILAGMYGFRQRALDVTNALFPPPESALLAGILLGDDSQIPAPLSDAFKDTGTAHIIAISGFNIAILAGLLATLFSRLAGPRWGALLAALGIVFYTLLVGAGASVVRAAIMGGLGLLAGQVGRRQLGLNSLGATALAMILLSPAWLWDAGFQLSFLATLGMILYATPLQDGLVRLADRLIPARLPARAADAIGEFFLFTLAAEAFTLPVQLAQFGRLSLVALAANPLILPPQPAVMALGGLAALAGLVWLPAGQALAALAWPFVAYTIRMVTWLASLPGAALTTGPVSGWVAAGLIGLALLPAIGWQRLGPVFDRLRTVLRPSLALAGLAILTALVWRTTLANIDGRLRISLVGGQARSGVLVQTPSGNTLLFDGGTSADQLSQALGERLPPFQRRLGALVVTGASQDALTALPEVIDQYPPGTVWWSGDPAASAAATLLWERLSALGIPVEIIRPGLALDLGGGARLAVEAPGGTPQALRLDCGSFRAFVPLVEVNQKSQPAGASALLVLPPAFLKDTPIESWRSIYQPQSVLVSGLLSAPEAPGMLSTGQHGWIQAATDGEQLWIEVQSR